MKIAIFGDVHGEISKLTRSVQDWQRQKGEAIDYVLQVGDLGIYGGNSYFAGTKSKQSEFELENLLRREELGDLLTGENDFEKVPPIYFIDGNHDNRVYLEECAGGDNNNKPFVEITEGLNYIRRGRQVKLRKKDEMVTVNGLGGIESTERPHQYHKFPSIAFTEAESTNLLSYLNPDIFLTHMHPAPYGGGSEEIFEILEQTKPRYHIFGHHGSYFENDVKGVKQFGLRRIQYPHSKNIKQGSMIVVDV